MDIFKVNSGDRPPAGNKELTPRRRKKIKKADISMPKDFVHVSTVKYRSRRKVPLDFSDPVLQNFLKRADVNINRLSNPEILHVVTNFIERVGLDAIRKESESSKPLFLQAENVIQTPIEESKSLSRTDTKHETDSTLKSADEKSLIFSPEHDVEITTEMDDVFTIQLDPRISTISSENDEVEGVDSPELRLSVTAEGEGKIDHATFLNELQAAIRKRNIRMKLQRQDEQKRGEKIWSDLTSAKSKRRVSFFEAEKSPSPKQIRTVHTRWDLTDESSDTDNSVLKNVEEDGVNDIERISPSEVVDGCEGNSKMECDVNASVKPKLPLSKGIEALSRVFPTDKLNEPRVSPVENEGVPDMIIDCGALDVQKHVESTSINPNTGSENTPQELKSFKPEVTPERKEDLLVETERNDEIKDGIPGQNLLREKKSPEKSRIAQWFSRKRNKASKEISNDSTISKVPEVKVEDKITENNVIESSKTKDTMKGKKERGKQRKDTTCEEGKAESKGRELNSDNFNNIIQPEIPTKKERKSQNHNVFSSLKGKKKIPTATATDEEKEELPKACDTCANVKDGEENKDPAEKTSPQSPKLNPLSKKQPGEARRRVAVKKKDICLMRDMRHVTHITWDPERHNFLINHTDDDDLRKILLQEKLCLEMPAHKQRRNSYSMAMDCSDFDTGKCQIKPDERRSFSLSSATWGLSRAEKKRVPLPRPKSDLPKYEHGTYL